MQRRERITKGRDFFMKLVAAGFDVIGALANAVAIGGTVVSIFGDLTFLIWYLIIGAGIIRGKTLRRAGIMMVIEFIPFVNVLPGFSFFVWSQNRAIMKEDEEFNKKNEKKIKEFREVKSNQAKDIEQSRQRELEEQSMAISKDLRAYPISIGEEGEDQAKAEEERLKKEQFEKELEEKIKEIKTHNIGEDLNEFKGNPLGSARPSRSSGEVEYDKDPVTGKTRREHGYLPVRKQHQPTASPGAKVDGIRKSPVVGSAPVMRSDGNVSYEERKVEGPSTAYIPSSSRSSSGSSGSTSSYSHVVPSKLPGYMEKRDSSSAINTLKKTYRTITPGSIQHARKNFASDPDISAFLNSGSSDQEIADRINMS